MRREIRERERNRLNTLKSRSSNPGLSRVEANLLGGLSGINTVSLATATLLLISDDSVLGILTLTIIIVCTVHVSYVHVPAFSKAHIQVNTNETVRLYFLKW